MDPPLPPESALLAAKSRGASSRLFRPAPPAGSHVLPRPSSGPLGWTKWPRGPLARVAGERCRGRRPTINCQKFTALCLFKPSSESEPYPPR
jgi:hypothetical protein